MRPIKFRLINDGKVVGYELHELDTPGGTINIYHNDMNIEAVKDAYIPHDSKDQYTGLKDKNGVEIYEGDILILNCDDDENYKVVEYYEHLGKFEFKGYQCPCTQVSLVESVGQFRDTTKVIGNIHQNPELLTQ